ncbi:MAG: DNA polymerase Y family protein [Myxococcota bacterium]|nr:DNA polymerase Y family protein [Myxococcota bacterium]
MHTPSRLLVAWLPAFRLERCGWLAHERVVLVTPRHGALRVAALTPAASQVGLRVGMSATECRALIPGVQLEHLESLSEEEADLNALSIQLHSLSPTVQSFSQDSIGVEIGSTAPLKGGEPACMKHAVQLLGGLGHVSKIVIVDAAPFGSAHAARALAIHGNQHAIISPGSLENALSPVPLVHLGASPALQQRLLSLGIHTAGDLAQLPTASVANRFGTEGLRVQATCRATIPRNPRPLSPRLAPTSISARSNLPVATCNRIALQPILVRLLEQICQDLQSRELAATRLSLRFLLEDAPEQRMPIRLGRAQREPTALWHLVEKRLEHLELPAAITAVELEVMESSPHRPHQASLLDRRQPTEPLPDLLARLEDALGQKSCFTPHPANEHRPESTWEAAPYGNESKHTHMPCATRQPSLLLRTPRPIQVRLDTNQSPCAVEVEGRWSNVRNYSLRERIEGGWWSIQPYARDYMRLGLEDGRHPWIFQDRKYGSWWLHGWFE